MNNKTGTSSSGETVLTMDMIKEAEALIKALAPKEAPEGTLLIKGLSGLNIMKNEMIPNDTIIVSKRLFDLIFASSKPAKETRYAPPAVINTTP